MRVAIVSDIHGNLTAFEAVLADIRGASPDLILQGGDLADAGSSPVEIVDRVRELGWPGVMGNTDEMLVRPDSLEDFARQSSSPPTLWDAIRRIASATRSALGPERLAWLGGLPLVHTEECFALTHATPQSCWRAPSEHASDAELELAYESLPRPVVIFGHTHRPGIRNLPGRLLINAGSVGLPFDGDPRASWLLLDGDIPTLRRVEYDLQRELWLLAASGLPGAEWTARILRTSSPQMP